MRAAQCRFRAAGHAPSRWPPPASPTPPTAVRSVPTLRRPSTMRLAALVILIAGALPLASAAPAARTAEPGAAPAGQNERIAERVFEYVRAQTQGLPGNVQITVGALDARTRLAACDDLQPFTPAGGRLWGPASVGVRCVRPTPWQVFVPVTVRVSGPVLVANRALVAGTVIDAADVGTRVEELTVLPASVLTDAAQAVGRTLAAAVPAGAALRAESLKQVLAVVQGQTVRVVYESATISVSADGRALGSAAIGQGVEVRVGSGKTVRGIVRANGEVVVR